MALYIKVFVPFEGGTGAVERRKNVKKHNVNFSLRSIVRVYCKIQSSHCAQMEMDFFFQFLAYSSYVM